MNGINTKAISSGRPKRIPDGPINTSISLNSTYVSGGDIGYGRYGNDSCTSLEEAISSLEGGKTLAFSSGMSAISSIFSNIPIGSIVVASNQGYAGVNATLKKLNDEKKIIARFVDISNTGEVLANLENAYMLWIESPTNPRLDVADLNRLIHACKRSNIYVGVDNTFATPINQKPLELGADISMNSVTKYLAGHSDVLMGSISTNNNEIYEKIEFSRKLNGSIAQPFEAWLALRGIRTFPLRFKKAEENAKTLFKLISNHPNVSKVYYPGFGAMISFEIDTTPENVDLICYSSKIITYATSLGSVESLWERRRKWALESPLVSESLVRLSVGCEDVEDLWQDIQDSFSIILDTNKDF
jgi:cystathionine gamma-synthase